MSARTIGTGTPPVGPLLRRVPTNVRLLAEPAIGETGPGRLVRSNGERIAASRPWRAAGPPSAPRAAPGRLRNDSRSTLPPRRRTLGAGAGGARHAARPAPAALPQKRPKKLRFSLSHGPGRAGGGGLLSRRVTSGGCGARLESRTNARAALPVIARPAALILDIGSRGDRWCVPFGPMHGNRSINRRVQWSEWENVGSPTSIKCGLHDSTTPRRDPVVTADGGAPKTRPGCTHKEWTGRENVAVVS